MRDYRAYDASSSLIFSQKGKVGLRKDKVSGKKNLF